MNSYKGRAGRGRKDYLAQSSQNATEETETKKEEVKCQISQK